MVGGDVEMVTSFGGGIVIGSCKGDIVGGRFVGGACRLKVQAIEFLQIVVEEFDAGIVGIGGNDGGGRVEHKLSLLPMDADGLWDDGCGGLGGGLCGGRLGGG